MAEIDFITDPEFTYNGEQVGYFILYLGPLEPFLPAIPNGVTTDVFIPYTGTYFYESSNSYAVTSDILELTVTSLKIEVIPEPSTATILLAGGALAALARRRKTA